MGWNIDGTAVYESWYRELLAADQLRVDYVLARLEAMGPALGRPFADAVKGSVFSNMKELRAQAGGNPLRILFAFDPTRTAILLVGGDKTGDDRFYAKTIRQADKLYAEHLAELAEGE